MAGVRHRLRRPRVLSNEVLVLALVVGAGTWALRYLPVRARFERGSQAAADGSRGQRLGPGAAAMRRFLEAIGVAAVSALAAASLLPYVRDLVAGAGRPVGDALALAIGVTATLLAFLPRRSVGAGTLAGAAAYGLGLWLLSGA